MTALSCCLSDRGELYGGYGCGFKRDKSQHGEECAGPEDVNIAAQKTLRRGWKRKKKRVPWKVVAYRVSLIRREETVRSGFSTAGILVSTQLRGPRVDTAFMLCSANWFKADENAQTTSTA